METKKAKTKKIANSKKAVKKENADLELAVFDQTGKTTGKINLPAAIFGVVKNDNVIRQVLEAQQASSRQPLAHAKDRSEVRGGGKKPWRQKGTGRSRHGSIRSPLWKGGGVTFGPRKEKNFARKINKKVKKQALFMVLSGKLNDGELIILDDIKLTAPKTKEMAVIVKSLKNGVKADFDKGAIFVFEPGKTEIIRATRNLPKIETLAAGSLNINDLLSKKYLVITKPAVTLLEKTYGNI